MIRNWRSADARRIFEGGRPRGFPADLVRSAKRRLELLHQATTLDDLRAIRGNRLHPLVGDRAGQWAVRINDQYRICFRWVEEGAEDVEIVDYH